MTEQGSTQDENDANMFQCPVCLDTLNYPISLPCGHMLCFACLEQATMNLEQHECPICQSGFKPEELRPIYAGKTDGDDPRHNIIKQFREADAKRRYRHQNEQIANPPQFQFRFGFGGLMFPGIQMNFGNVPLEFNNNIFGRVVNRPPPRRLVKDMNTKEKIKYYTVLLLKILAIVTFMAVYLKLLSIQNFRQFQLNHGAEPKKNAEYARGNYMFYF